MSVQITTAPCCWGVDDPHNPHLPAWKTVLQEAGQAGYPGLELGPYGYLPLNAVEVQQQLDKNELFIVAGTIFDDLVGEGNLASLRSQARNICTMLTKLEKAPVLAGQKQPAPYLVLIDWGHDERDYAAGHPDAAPRLAPETWQGMMSHIAILSDIAREFGVRPVIHPHAGGYIEFEDEIAQLMEDIPYETAGFLLDTGHLYYGKMDPVAMIHRYANRTDYVHFKDVNLEKYEEMMGRRIRFFDAVAEGVMCPLGHGALDYPAIRNALQESGYGGYITVEQERDPRNAAGSLKDVTESLQFLRRSGF